GRNPVKQVEMDVFYKKLHDLELKHGIKLINRESMFNIRKSKEYPKPFKKGQVIKAQIVCPGRFPGEILAVNCESDKFSPANLTNRLISIPNCHKQEGIVKIKIRRTKHNIFLGELL
ncbi:MAG: hypothetical protein AABX63_04960, partial [Nanoarchaeota archaeon]